MTTRKPKQSYRHVDRCWQTTSPWPLTFWSHGQCPLSNCHTLYVPRLVLIAQAIFLLWQRHRNRQTYRHIHKVTKPLITLLPAWYIWQGKNITRVWQ